MQDKSRRQGESLITFSRIMRGIATRVIQATTGWDRKTAEGFLFSLYMARNNPKKREALGNLYLGAAIENGRRLPGAPLTHRGKSIQMAVQGLAKADAQLYLKQMNERLGRLGIGIKSPQAQKAQALSLSTIKPPQVKGVQSAHYMKMQ